MTTMAAVIPSPAELNAMRQRTHERLTHEGAQSWYVNDVSTLLDEVIRLREVIYLAVESFAADGVVIEGDETLYEMAQLWKAQATGFWEKTQTKKLRSEISELRQDRERLAQTSAEFAQIIETDKARIEVLNTGIELLEKDSRTQAEAYSVALQAEQAEQVSLRDEIVRLNKALVDCSERCEQVVAMQRAQYDDLWQRAMEYVDHAADVLRTGRES